MRAAAFVLLLSGCGGAYAGLVGACEAAEQIIEDRCAPVGGRCTGDMTIEEAHRRIDEVRAGCDAIGTIIEAEVEAAEEAEE